jgi:hypothetical protein
MVDESAIGMVEDDRIVRHGRLNRRYAKLRASEWSTEQGICEYVSWKPLVKIF